MGVLAADWLFIFFPPVWPWYLWLLLLFFSTKIFSKMPVFLTAFQATRCFICQVFPRGLRIFMVSLFIFHFLFFLHPFFHGWTGALCSLRTLRWNPLASSPFASPCFSVSYETDCNIHHSLSSHERGRGGGGALLLILSFPPPPSPPLSPLALGLEEPSF